MIYVGMDVHVRNSYLHVTDAEGQVLKRGRCGNTLMDVARFLSSVELKALATADPMCVALENTTNARAIQRLLLGYGRDAGVVLTAALLDARKLRIIAESVTKCDRLDASVINQLTRSNLKLPTCYVPDDEEFALREHLRARTDLVRIRTMLKNRVHAVLHRRGILRPARMDLFTVLGRRFLAELELGEAFRYVMPPAGVAEA